MSESRKQITFDLSQDALERYYPQSERAQSEQYYRKAYQDIRRFMEKQGFAWQQHSIYVSEAPMTTMDVVLLSQRMAERFPLMRLCVKEITATDIGAQYSLLGLLRSDAAPAELLPPVPRKRTVFQKRKMPER